MHTSIGKHRLLRRAWGKVKYVKEHIKASKTGPRVGKAISIILDLDDETIREWFLIS